MKIEEQTNEITEEASDPLGPPDSQEEQDKDWSSEDLSPEQRQQYERGVASVDEFLSDERTKRYEPTDANREKLLAYLEQHDLPMSFAGLYVAFEQLSEAGELELNSDGQAADEDQERDASARLATAGLARGNRSGEEEETNQEPPELEESKSARGKPIAWRNGRAVIGVGS